MAATSDPDRMASAVPTNSVDEMRAAVFFEGPLARHRNSRFWMLLTLAAVIASAGVVTNSTATVIGAMIVAPLMTPILGIALATVLGDHRNLLRSWALVIGGAASAIVIGYLVGLVEPAPVVAATNAQVAARVAPDLMDLVAALATGVVGAIALVRKDISDTLPGVAIAISLVPPLTVVGLTLESGALGEAVGAALLFVANVVSILATGIVVLGLYRIGGLGRATPVVAHSWARRQAALIAIVVTLVIIGAPLAVSSVRITGQSVLQARVSQSAQPWAEQHHVTIVGVTASGSTATIQVSGAPPVPDTSGLVSSLKRDGVDPSQVSIVFVPTYQRNLGASTSGGG